MPEDLSSNTIDITPQIAPVEETKKKWLSDKADLILASDDKKELIINLIEDFNMAYQGCKQIEKIAKEGSTRKTSSGLRSSLVEVARFFDPSYLPPKA